MPIRFSSLEEFIEKSKNRHGDKYNYDPTIYTGSKNELKINCKIHGEFGIKPTDHLFFQSGCKKCNNSSKKECGWLDFMKIPDDNQHRQIIIKINNKKWYKVDGYLDGVIYEFNGSYWHGDPRIHSPNKINKSNNKKFKTLYKNTLEKEKTLKEAGYKIITMWEYDWDQSPNNPAFIHEKSGLETIY